MYCVVLLGFASTSLSLSLSLDANSICQISYVKKNYTVALKSHKLVWTSQLAIYHPGPSHRKHQICQRHEPSHIVYRLAYNIIKLHIYISTRTLLVAGRSYILSAENICADQFLFTFYFQFLYFFLFLLFFRCFSASPRALKHYF